jgi:nicotinate-nucleotide adenylyltransferase
LGTRTETHCGLARFALTLRHRVGLFGGAFDPPHRAHLLVAQQALAECGLERVLLIPNGIPPEKSTRPQTKEDRFRMVQLLVRGRRGLSASRIEIDREGPSYTIDTIRAMKDDYSQGLCFILGADRLLGIHTWKESRALLRSVPFIVAPRDGIPWSAFGGSPYDEAVLHLLEMEPVDLSSSFVREKVANGEDIEEWVPRGVAAYVRSRGLYRERKNEQGVGGSYRQ